LEKLSSVLQVSTTDGAFSVHRVSWFWGLASYYLRQGRCCFVVLSTFEFCSSNFRAKIV